MQKKSHLAQKSYGSTFCDMSHHTITTGFDLKAYRLRRRRMATVALPGTCTHHWDLGTTARARDSESVRCELFETGITVSPIGNQLWSERWMWQYHRLLWNRGTGNITELRVYIPNMNCVKIPDGWAKKFG